MGKDYALYLRKSRADVEAEARGEGETLARHRRALMALAAQRGLVVADVYEEIVSGDTIAARPQMQALLSAVSEGRYAGVLVNDADRLARGDGIDQGLVKQAFYSTGTLIITPIKTYDPANDADEDFFDFSLFMARFEYRKIKHRMQTGRKRSAAEGNYQSPKTTFGYKRVERADRSGWTLEPDPDTAPVVRQIYKWYLEGKTTPWIDGELYKAGVRGVEGGRINHGYVRNILRNPTYIGTVTWDKKVSKTVMENGQRITRRVKNDHPIVAENAHEAIVDRATWDAVQEMFATHKKLPKNTNAPTKNIFGGLVRCPFCRATMQRKEHVREPRETINCLTQNCPTKGITMSIMENSVLEFLEGWIVKYDAPQGADTPKEDPRAAEIDLLKKQLSAMDQQMDRLYDLVEQGVYAPQVFARRRDELQGRIDGAKTRLSELQNNPTTEESIRRILPKVKSVLEVYKLTTDPAEKNDLLKSIIDRIVYHKTKQGSRWANPADLLTLEIYPRIIQG